MTSRKRKTVLMEELINLKKVCSELKKKKTKKQKLKKPLKFSKSQTWFTNVHDCLNPNKHILCVHFWYQHATMNKEDLLPNGHSWGQGRWWPRELLGEKQNQLWQDELAKHVFNCQGRKSTRGDFKEHQWICILFLPFPNCGLYGGDAVPALPLCGYGDVKGTQITALLAHRSLDNGQLDCPLPREPRPWAESSADGTLRMHLGEQMDVSANGRGTHTILGWCLEGFEGDQLVIHWAFPHIFP